MKRLIFFVLFYVMTFAGFQKAHAIDVLGHQVVFKGAATEWSEPIVDTLTTPYMRSHGQAGILIRVRVRVTRKIVRGCRYEVEVTNLDPTRKLSFEMIGLGAEKKKKHKTKPGETTVFGTDTFLKKNCPSVEDCGNGTCEYDIAFYNVNVK